MRMTKIGPLLEGDRIFQDLFRLTNLEIKHTETGKSYLLVMLENSSNCIPGILLNDPFSVLEDLKVGMIIEASGKVIKNNDKLYLEIEGIKATNNKTLSNFFISKNDDIELILANDSEDKSLNPSKSKLSITKSYIGYTDGEKYYPRSGLTKEIVKILAQVNKGRRKQGRLVIRTTIKNLRSILSFENNKVNEEKIKVAIYTIKDNPVIKKLPLRISINNDEVEIIEN